MSPDTIERFARALRALRACDAEAMAPVYGLAEAAVGLAFPPLGRGPLIDRVERERLHPNGGALPASAG